MPQGSSTPSSSIAQRPLLIVAAGHTFPDMRAQQGDFDDWISRGLGPAMPQLRIDAQLDSDALPDPATLSGVVVSGSHAMVSHREPWSEQLGQWMRRCVEAGVPVLGICYGHQLLAHAFGGHVDDLPGGPEVGTHGIHLAAAAQEDPLLAGLPAHFPAQLVHYQSVLGLPAGATLLASSRMEPHQAFRVGACGWGVQFHPEFSAAAMRGYLSHVNATRNAASQLDGGVGDTPHAASVLGRFAALAQARELQTAAA